MQKALHGGRGRLDLSPVVEVKDREECFGHFLQCFFHHQPVHSRDGSLRPCAQPIRAVKLILVVAENCKRLTPVVEA